MDDEKIEQGLSVTDEDRFWMDSMRKMAAQSPKSIESAAKQLISMITVIQGLYAAVLAFSGISQIPKGSVFAVIFYGLPIMLWLISLFFVLRVYKSRRYHYRENSPDEARDTLQEIADFKYGNLNKAYYLFCAGFLVALAGIMYWLYCGAAG